MANKLRAQIDQLKNKIEELNLKVQGLNNDLENEKNNGNSILQTKELEWHNSNETIKKQYEDRIAGLDNQVGDLEDTLKEKQDQLDRKELKKLAVAFNDQEVVYKDDQGKWLTALVITAVLLI